jgi:hypothetical protein
VVEIMAGLLVARHMETVEGYANVCQTASLSHTARRHAWC